MCVLSHVSLQPHGLFACQAPLSMGFSRQKYWSGLPCLPPGDLPNPGIEPTSPAPPGRFTTTEPPLSLKLHLNISGDSCLRSTALWEGVPPAKGFWNLEKLLLD